MTVETKVIDKVNVVVISTGSYSDYTIINILIGPKDIDVSQIIKDLEKQEPSAKDFPGCFGNTKKDKANFKKFGKALEDWESTIYQTLKENGFQLTGDYEEINI